MVRLVAAVIFATAFLFATASFAAEGSALTISNHAFSVETLQVPAGKRIKLAITNADKTAEEFDSSDLHVEKMIPGGQTASVFIGPLKPGTYSFVGELHRATAHGKIIAK